MRGEGGGLEYLKKRMLHHTEAKKKSSDEVYLFSFSLL